MAINWSILGNAPDPGQAFQAGLEHGRGQYRQRQSDNALAALSRNPDDPQAQNALIALGPQGAQSLQAIHAMREMRRQESIQRGEASAYDAATGKIDPNKLRQAHAANGDVAGAMQLDAQQQQQQLTQLEFAHKVNEYGLQELGTVHDEATWQSAKQRYSAFLAQHNLPVPQLPDHYTPEGIRALQEQSLSTKEQLEMHKGVVVGDGSSLNDPFTGAELAHNQKSKKYTTFQVRNADGTTTPYAFDPETRQAFPLNADGTPAQSGGTPSTGGTGQRRSNGWTPRARDGGDNSDQVVDSKVAHLSSAVGVDPDAPLTPAQLSQLAVALPATEGGAGSKAARNNNPGNIQSGSFARSQPGYVGADSTGYARFATQADGQKAMEALLGRYYARGQRSIRDIIEGKPTGGGHAAAAPAASGTQITGRASPGTGLSSQEIRFYAEDVANGGDMPQLGMGRDAAKARQQILAEAARIQTAAGGTGADFGAMRADKKALRGALNHLQQSSAMILAFERTANENGRLALDLAAKANIGNTPVLNRWINAGRKEIGGDPDVASFHAAVETFSNEYARITATATGGGVTSDAAREHVRAMINGAMAPKQFQSVMKTLFQEMANRKKGLQDERDDIIRQLRSPHGSQGGDAPAHPGSLPTLTPEQYRAAPSGTRFLTTDGRPMRKP